MTGFRAVFEAAPSLQQLLAADAPLFTVLAASRRYCDATMMDPTAAIGRGLFEDFPDANPLNPVAVGVERLRASLETVLVTAAEHRMDIVRYGVERPDGGWVERYWSPRNVPVIGPDGSRTLASPSAASRQRRMGGRISVEDAQPHGSRFVVETPSE